MQDKRRDSGKINTTVRMKDTSSRPRTRIITYFALILWPLESNMGKYLEWSACHAKWMRETWMNTRQTQIHADTHTNVADDDVTIHQKCVPMKPSLCGVICELIRYMYTRNCCGRYEYTTHKWRTIYTYGFGATVMLRLSRHCKSVTRLVSGTSGRHVSISDLPTGRRCTDCMGRISRRGCFWPCTASADERCADV